MIALTKLQQQIFVAKGNIYYVATSESGPLKGIKNSNTLFLN